MKLISFSSFRVTHAGCLMGSTVFADPLHFFLFSITTAHVCKVQTCIAFMLQFVHNPADH
jgi:hypothetical protein